MKRVLSKLGSLNSIRLGCLLEAFALLTCFRFALIFFPVQRIVEFVCSKAVDFSQQDAPLTANGNNVIWAIRVIVLYTPFQFVCFPQALAGFWMLRRRGFHASIVYGVARNTAQALVAHTWLKSGETVLLGEDGVTDFHPIAIWF